MTAKGVLATSPRGGYPPQVRAALLLFAILASCADTTPASAGTKLTFVHQPLWGDPGAFRELLASFGRAHPDITLTTQTIPSASDLAHQYFLTALEGGSVDVDVLVIDVVWVAEFARAGWIADLSDLITPEQIHAEFIAGMADAATPGGRTFAVPWFADTGLLYWRTDLVPRAPRTFEELRAFAGDAMERDPELRGFLWQGRQYEGLNCNVAEAIWGHGGTLVDDGGIRLDTPPARAALDELRGFITSGISPTSVTSMAEEESRRLFQSGRAVFMRNWPYAWATLQAEDSSVRGKVAVAPLPTLDGKPGAGALGGWLLAVNVRSPNRRAAAALVEHLTSAEANVVLALSYARVPPRPAVFADPRFREGAPFLATLLPALERARPRPLTPAYLLLSDVLQSEFSAAIVGVRPPAEALGRAQHFVNHIERAIP